MNKKLICTVILAFILTGCASSVKRPQVVEFVRYSISPQDQISSVSVHLTEEATRKALDNSMFKPELLLTYVKGVLKAKSLLSESGDQRHPSLEILIKDVRVRSNFSAIVWGFMAGADFITADIVLKDEAGTEIDRFETSVSYAFGGIAGGQGNSRLAWMYAKFAEQAVEELVKQ